MQLEIALAQAQAALNIIPFEAAASIVSEATLEKVNIERESRLWIVAKARIWASEGWNVVVTDNEGKSYGPADFEKLWAA